MAQPINLTHLVAILKDHDVEAWIENDTLRAIDVFTHNGILHMHPVTVEPTLKAVREFLNY